MITTEEALEIIFKTTREFGIEEIPLSESIGRVLKEDWYTDRALPPYDRITMDGIAINFNVFKSGIRNFPIEGVSPAGSPQTQLSNSNNCLEVMTGSILPRGCDTVIRYEDLEIKENNAKVTIEGINFQQNIHFKGVDREIDSLVVKKNTLISAAEIGVGASIGKTKVKIAKNPKVIIISTGDELVNIDKTPLSHQIRRSNVYRLKTELNNHNVIAYTDHLNDNKEEIRKKLQQHIETYDAIILSGGVSKGKFDFIPEVLYQIGVEKLFHRVKQKPGKPFWFGQYGSQCTVFALPGNPVSSFVCMYRYFTPWLQKCLSGSTPLYPNAMLTQDVIFNPDLTYYIEVKISYDTKGRILATPMKGNGSGDLANLVNADAFIELPRGKNIFKAEEVYPVVFYRKNI